MHRDGAGRENEKGSNAPHGPQGVEFDGLGWLERKKMQRDREEKKRRRDKAVIKTSPSSMHFLKAVAFGLSLAVSVSALAIGDVKETVNHLVERATPAQDTDRLLYSTSMSSFLTARRNKTPSNLIWSSDGCTILSDTPSGFNFLPSCQRHDFGYRNYKAQNRCSAADRDKVDGNFLTDMLNKCEGYADLQKCREIAITYYYGVRKLGGLRWC
ncbi:hypothetical protein H2201_002617 [Coniosporium apollinis]|uniref:Uncharacterized protein n=1 Tax=Coniosporium apollinis TaxID=61459 RepID=A0ABQ9P271_9PEZI|nr:hypothetical protein H2201_002617 [Coniosporium apollinis]